jgi:rhamnose transport system permease protein
MTDLVPGLATLPSGDTFDHHQTHTDFPASFEAIGQTYFFGELVPAQLIVFLLFAALVWFILHGTILGRRLYAIGNNRMD